MKVQLPLAAALLAICAASNAQQKAEDWPSTSGMHNAINARSDLDVAEQELTKKFEDLLVEVRAAHAAHKFFAYDINRFIDSLKKSQSTWRAFRVSVCEAEGIATQAGSSWQNVRAHRCEQRLIEERSEYLGKLTSWILEGFDD